MAHASDEVNEAVGASITDEHDVEIARLQAELNQPSEREVKQQQLAALKAQKRVRRLAQLKAVAEKRLVAIKRADGSLHDQEPQDENRVLDAARKYEQATRTLDERAARRKLLAVEARLLAEAFELSMPELSMVEIPARREMAVEAVRIVYGAQLAGTLYINAAPDHAELDDLPGRELLRQQAALELQAPPPVRPTPTLTPGQADVLATEAARVQERRALG